MGRPLLLESKRSRNWRSLIDFLLLSGCIMQSDKLCRGFAVNGQSVVDPIEARSSPSHIIAKKGTSVWLHWNYTYIGDGLQGLVLLTYREQIIRLGNASQPSINVLAKRIGQNGVLTLELPVPAAFTGRAQVISSNSTLVIHNLQYNDSNYQFSSIVNLNADIGGGIRINTFNLRPVVSITVNGIPDFKEQPPFTLDVNEGSSLHLRIEMDGNPQPSADFRWSHLTGSSPSNVPGVPLYPFVYSSTYALRNIDGSYCGRILQTTLRNNIGSSRVRNTNVTVLLKLDIDFGLRAGKTAKSKCVEVKWNKADSGACYVKYEVLLKNASGNGLGNATGYNIGEMMICNLPSSSNITNVQLTVSFKATSTNVTANVGEAPLSVTASTASAPSISTGLILCGTLTAFSKQIIGSVYSLA